MPLTTTHATTIGHPEAHHVMGRLLAVTVGTLVMGAGPAAAWSLPQRCGGPPGQANVCLNGHTHDPWVYAHVGVDVYMSVQDAQAIIDQPGLAFSAALYAWDGPAESQKHFLVDLPELYETVAPHGLSAEFDDDVLRSRLNEDSGGWPRPNFDEVFARVRLYDARTGESRVFDTGYWSIQF